MVDLRTRALEESNQKLRKLSSLDDLTGLRNRRDFRANAEKEVSRFRRDNKPFSILMLDIDHFKQINDERGHACGDHVLVECSAMLTSLLRHQDLLARWGGEEFIILAVDSDLTHATLIAEKLRIEINQRKVEYDEETINVSFTIGVSEIKANQSLDDCIRVADENLYIGKRNGRNRTIS
ncbi:GGDEF domain-containing protein [Aliiglaciecola sp.]|nr:GGDEF domain-containing protein [Aliiglaciecola sp.]